MIIGVLQPESTRERLVRVGVAVLGSECRYPDFAFLSLLASTTCVEALLRYHHTRRCDGFHLALRSHSPHVRRGMPLAALLLIRFLFLLRS